MTQRMLTSLAFAALTTAGLVACNPISGVHLNSQVMQGAGQGLLIDSPNGRAQSNRAQAAAPSQAPISDQSWSAAPVSASTLAPAAVQSAPLASANTAPQVTASTPLAASAQSFVGQKTTVVGLGDPGRDGLWMETPLVSSRRNARLTAPNGKSVVVTLEPISGDAGQGSRLSIDGMRALGLPLTELVEIRVGPA